MEVVEIDRDYFETLTKRIRELERQLTAITNNATPTVPIYDPADFPVNSIEGQIALGTDGSGYKYQSGAWDVLGSAGIQFDQINTGDWLNIVALDTTGNGISLDDQGAGGIKLTAAGSGELLLKATGSGGVTVFNIGSSDLLINNQGPPGSFLRMNCKNAIFIQTSLSTSPINIFSAGNVNITALGTTGITLSGPVITGPSVQMVSLPTVSPGIAGRLWNSGGVVHVV